MAALGLGIPSGWALWQPWHQSRLVAADYVPAPPGMVLVPAGEFLMGSDHPGADPDERPLRRRFLPAFYIDRHEVTHRAYQAFRRDHSFPEEAADEPVTGLLKSEAEAYAAFMGKRLPTSAEWEKAARGTDGRRFPWGDAYEEGRANVRPPGVPLLGNGTCAETGQPLPPALSLQRVGSYPRGASPYGVMDMCGNAWEWVADEWRDRNALGLPSGFARGVLRGGAYAYPPHLGTTSYQAFESLETTCNDVGFRCARDAVRR